jgi:hypothetical protein
MNHHQIHQRLDGPAHRQYFAPGVIETRRRPGLLRRVLRWLWGVRT